MRNLCKIYVCTILIFTSDCLNEKQKIHETVEKLLSKSEPYKHVLKRYDQEYQTCLENFEIRDDKIIRTQDSRDMGAKYITEFDLGSRDECLRACCGMETCDVFVFEEKNPGSCYLFHCGPADDFKCKFTKHHNYTSAILQTNRHLSELETQIKLTKHEQELSRLRLPKTTSQSTGSPLQTTMLVPEPAKETLQMASAVSNGTTFNRHCSSFQFECRTSNECIAIYNACDGIPQCADGSDEAPELDCPTQGTTQSPVLLPRLTLPPQSIMKEPLQVQPPSTLQNNYHNQQQAIQQQGPAMQPDQQQPISYNNNNNGGPPFRQPSQQPWQQISQQQQPQQAQQYPQQNLELNNQPKLFPQGSNQGLPNKMYGREGEGPTNNFNAQWNNFQHVPSNQYQGSSIGSHLYEDGTSHIFNHKGNGLMADSDSPPGQYAENIHGGEYKYPNNNNDGGNNMYYNNPSYRQPVPQSSWGTNTHLSPHDTGPIGNVGDLSRTENDRKLPLPPDYYYEDNQAHDARFHSPADNEHVVYPQQQVEKVNPQMPLKSIQGLQPAFVSPIQGSLDVNRLTNSHTNKGNIEFQVKADSTPSQRESTTSTAIPKPKKNPASNLKVEPTAATDVAMALEGVEVEGSRPTGAILSLSLGMCICAIFMALVSCRVRMIRKRLRRGGKSPYTHDADYLVNGMYL